VGEPVGEDGEPGNRPAPRYTAPNRTWGRPHRLGAVDGERLPLAPRPLTEPHPNRLSPTHPRRSEILAKHAIALAAGEAFYTDPDTGLSVLTAGYLAARGTCCGRGCRHCPYLDGKLTGHDGPAG
jgi:Family of unknown function (DUF5522)